MFAIWLLRFPEHMKPLQFIILQILGMTKVRAEVEMEGAVKVGVAEIVEMNMEEAG